MGKKYKAKSTRRTTLKSNLKAAIKRRINKGAYIPKEFIESINDMSVQRLSALSRNRYKALDNLIPKFEKPSVQEMSTDDLFIHQRLSELVRLKYISPKTPDEVREYKDIIEYIMTTPYTKVAEDKESADVLLKSKSNAAFWLMQKDPELFNKSWKVDKKDEKPDDKNTMNTSTAVYDSIMYEIDTAFGSGNDAERFLATKLEEMLQDQIDTYGFDKAMKGINMADGWLLATAVGFIYDSNQFSDDQWKGSLEAMAHVIQGYIDDDTRQSFAELNTLLESVQF